MAGSVKANKNQTAAERALLTEALSGKQCCKCGKDIKIKELLNVKQLSLESGQKSMMSYHRACYQM